VAPLNNSEQTDVLFVAMEGFGTGLVYAEGIKLTQIVILVMMKTQVILGLVLFVVMLDQSLLGVVIVLKVVEVSMSQ
jgi:hypothetical protein